MKLVKDHHIDKSYPRNAALVNILHVDLGTFEGTKSWMKSQGTLSYHWYVRRYADEIVEFIPPERGAWHAGRMHNATPEAQAELNRLGILRLNTSSYGICYEGRPIDKNGSVPVTASGGIDWNRVVDGERATDKQVEMTAQFLFEREYHTLPTFAHKEVTSYKPACVLDFKKRVKDEIARIKTGEKQPAPCTLTTFTTQELWGEIFSRYGLKR